MSLDLLAIAAHPDDVEQTCGGTLIRMTEMGYRTGVLDLTAGDMGTRGSPEQRIAESDVAASHLLLKSEVNVKDGGNEVLQEIYYSGHKLIDGVQHAQKWAVKRDGKPFVDAEFTEITVHQQPLDDSIFAKP